MDEIAELDLLELWEYLASEISELNKHRDILGDSLDFIDEQEDLLKNER